MLPKALAENIKKMVHKAKDGKPTDEKSKKEKMKGFIKGKLFGGKQAPPFGKKSEVEGSPKEEATESKEEELTEDDGKGGCSAK
jgi:hypothetical protein